MNKRILLDLTFTLLALACVGLCLYGAVAYVSPLSMALVIFNGIAVYMNGSNVVAGLREKFSQGSSPKLI